MSTNRYQLRAAVYLVLFDADRVLLSRRFRTGWQDGKYSMPAGHLDGGETVTDAIIREAKEEVDISLMKNQTKIVHTMHRLSKSGPEYIDFFANSQSWVGEPKIMEKDKCDALDWFPIDNLPHNTLLHVKYAIAMVVSGVAFSEFGWDGNAE